MPKLSRIFKDYQETGALNGHVAVLDAVDDETFLTKSGDLLMVLRIKGIDYECLDPDELDQITRRFESALRTFDESFRIYQYLTKRDKPWIPAQAYDDPIVQEAISSRTSYLQNKSASLYSLEVHFVIVRETGKQTRHPGKKLSAFLKEPLRSLREMLSTGRAVTFLEAELDRECLVLREKVERFVIQLPEGIRATLLDKQRAFRFFRSLLNYSPFKVDVELKYDRFVDFQACDSALECHRDHLRLDDWFIQVMTVKEPPSQTFAHLLRGLQQIPCNFIICSEWRREGNAEMLKRIQSMRRHFHNKKTAITSQLSASGGAARPDVLIDDSAVARVTELGECLEEIEVKGNSFGEFSMTVLLFGQDRPTVERSAAEVYGVFARHSAALVDERYNQLNAWLAVLPGNSAYNLRKVWLLQNNYADLSFLFMPDTGETRNVHLGTEYLAVLETNAATPYLLNLHYQDVANTLILGASGSGKSFLSNFLLTHLMKYRPILRNFDVGASYENLTQLFGGA